MFDLTRGVVVYAHHEKMDPGFMRLVALGPGGTGADALDTARQALPSARTAEARHGRLTHLATCDLAQRPLTFRFYPARAGRVEAAAVERAVGHWHPSTSSVALGMPRKVAPRVVGASAEAEWTNSISYVDIEGRAWALLPELLPDGTAIHLYSLSTVERLFGTTISPYTRQPCIPEIDGVPIRKR